MTNSRSLPSSIAHLFEPYVPKAPARPLKNGPKVIALQPIMELLREAQGDNCSLCGKPMQFDCLSDDPMRPTVEHVIPRSKGGLHKANRLLAHHDCNVAKGNQMPSACELILLAAVNAIINGWGRGQAGPYSESRMRDRAFRAMRHALKHNGGLSLSPGMVQAIAPFLPKEITDGE